MTVREKMFAAALLLIIWGLFVAFGKAPVNDYVTGIRDILIALGVFTASMTNPTPKG